MSAIAQTRYQIIRFEELIVKVGSRLYARRLIDLICQLEAKLEVLVKQGIKLPGKTWGQKMKEYLESHNWTYRKDRQWYIAGFPCQRDPSKLYALAYRPVGVRDAGQVWIITLIDKKEIRRSLYASSIWKPEQLSQIAHEVWEIAHYR